MEVSEPPGAPANLQSTIKPYLSDAQEALESIQVSSLHHSRFLQSPTTTTTNECQTNNPRCMLLKKLYG
jgi:hypothetical protein